jgi:glycosyltransferase involved in cell wall biosynthesis
MLSSNYPPHTGGLEVVVQSLARGLVDRHRVTVVTSAWGGRSGVAMEDGVEVHRLPAAHRSEAHGIPYPIPLGPGVVRALDAIRDADIVHAHGSLYMATLMARMAAWRTGRPLVITEHVGFVPYPVATTNLLQRLAWATVGNAVVTGSAAVVALNQRVLDWLRTRYPRARLELIGNGVDTERFAPRPLAEAMRLRVAFGLPLDEVLGLFVGRAVAKKNLDALLALQCDGFRLVTCGAERRRLPKDVLDLGLVPYPRMPDLLACVDFMVLPSTGEGFPIAAQEALATGLPLILRWDEGYHSSLRRDVVAAYESPSDLDGIIRRVARDSLARAELSARGRAWAIENWSWQVTVARHEELYSEVRKVLP